MADGNAGVTADRAGPRQEIQWEIHEHGSELQVHGIQVPIPSFLPGMPADTPLSDLKLTVCMRLKVTDLCVHIAKKQAIGEANNRCAHPTAVHKDAPTYDATVQHAPMPATQAGRMIGHVSAGPTHDIQCVPVGDTQAEVGNIVNQTEIAGADTQADDAQASVTMAESQQY